MKRIRWVVIPIFFILACSILPLAFTEAARADEGKTSLDELTNLADSIIVGTVVERSSYWNDEHTGIYTSASLSVEERLKGTASQDRVTITLPGGEADGIGEWVSDMPSFEQGERTIVFLKKLSKSQLPKAKAFKGQLPEEQFEVYGGFRGKFAIKQNKVGNLPVAKFKDRVSKSLQGQPVPDGELDLALSVATFGYSYAGFCWPHPPAPVVSYRINENTTDCTGEGAAVQTAAATWNAPANFSFSYAGASGATAYSYNGINEVLWKNFGSGGTIAHALIWYSGSTILENDIEFNDYYTWSTSASCPGGYYDVQTIGLHELGHWLCLDDLYDPADSAKVMYGYGSTGTTKRALHADDIAGIQFIYGASALGITTTSLPDGNIGSAYSFTLQASGGTGSYTWSITSGSLPAGLTLTSSTGLISGTPTTAATSNFTTQVDDGSTTATQPLSITVTVPLQKLLGADDATAVGPVGGNYVVMDRFAAVATGSVTQIRVKCTTAGSVKVALYTDNAGSPGTLINANNTGASVVAGWNNISIPSTAVTSGTYYWIAYNSSLNCVGYSAFTGGAILYRAFSYSTDFPASAGAFANLPGYHSLVAGWGVSGPTPLTITTTSLPDGAVDVPYSQTLQASGGTGSYTWSITSGSLPAGLTLTSSTGLISGTQTTAATSNFTAQVNDGSSTATNALSITVNNLPQRLLGASSTTSAGYTPPGYLIMSKFTAETTGTLTQVRVYCGASGNVKAALYADSSGSPGSLLAANNNPTAVSAAQWSTVNIIPTPVTAGTVYWLAYVSDVTGVGYNAGAASRAYRAATYAGFTFPNSAGTVTIDAYYNLVAGWGVVTPPPLSITTTSLPNGTTGVAYSQTLQATGGSGSYTWSVTVGSLPAGLTINSSTGVISGTPTTAATSNFTVQVNDGSSTATNALSITVNNPPPLTITTTSLPAATIGVTYSATLEASGGIGGYTWSVTVGSLPAGLTINSSTGVISGTPTTAATSNFTVQVNDGSSTATNALSITVNNLPQRLLGASSTTSAGYTPPGYLIMSKFTAETTGTLTQVRVYCGASGNVKAALYADSSGSPGSLLAANNNPTAVSAAQWSTVNITPTPVTAGTVYWLAYVSDVTGVGYNAGVASRAYRAATYAGFTFPNSAGTVTIDAYYNLVAGWGMVTPPELPPPPSLLSPGETITFKWGTSTGATKYQLQVSTSSSFSTTVYDADVGNITTQEVTGLSPGTTYYWRVKAGNAAGWSNWSSARSVLADTVP